MTSDSITSLAELTSRDPSWQRALEIVREHLETSSHMQLVIRSAWNGSLDNKELIRMLGFSRMNLWSLIDAADLLREVNQPSATVLEHALHNLGIRYSAVVLGVNQGCLSVLRHKLNAHWKILMTEIMTRIEIGYRLGARVSFLGLEGGALSGFAHGIGLGLLYAHNTRGFQKWFSNPSNDSALAEEVFGCRPYQVAAFALQQLGFGHEVAFGTALGSGNLVNQHIEVSDQVFVWKAAVLWAEALREGRNYPADLKVRHFFPEVSPPHEGHKNPILEAVYAEISRIRKEGSRWTWHLPKPSYDATQTHLELPEPKGA